MNAAAHILTAVFVLVTTSTFSLADTVYRSKIGLDIRSLKPNLQNNVGWLAGVRTARFIGTSNAYIGLAGYFGSPQGDDPKINNAWYTGLILGYDGHIGKTMAYDLSLLAGLGAGKALTLEQTSYYVVEPSAGIGFQLGGGFRLTTGFSYLHMTNAASFSGATFGFRLEYKTITAIKEVDD